MMRTLLLLVAGLLALWLTPAAALAQEAPVAPDPMDVAGSLAASGLPIEDMRIFDVDTDPNRLLGRPGQYIAKVSWRDARADTSDATIELFADEATLLRRQRLTEAVSQTGGPFTQYSYANGPRLALLRLPFQLTPDQAADYESWLATL